LVWRCFLSGLRAQIAQDGFNKAVSERHPRRG